MGFNLTADNSPFTVENFLRWSFCNKADVSYNLLTCIDLFQKYELKGMKETADNSPFTVENFLRWSFCNKVIITLEPLVFMLSYKACIVTTLYGTTVIHNSKQWISETRVTV